MSDKNSIIDGLDVHFTDTGTGPVILFLHGWGASRSSFEALIHGLSSIGKRCIAPDLPGFGESELPNTPWNVSRYATFVRRFLDKLGVAAPDMVIGHSFGGRIAIKGVAKGTLKPNRLVLIASAGTAKLRRTRRAFFFITAKMGKLFTLIPSFFFFQKRLRGFLYKIAGNTDYLNAGPMEETLRNVIRENLKTEAERISIPTLLLWGDQDTETPLTEAYSLRKTIKNARLTVIPGAGHFVHQEMPQKIAEEIKKFLTP